MHVRLISVTVFFLTITIVGHAFAAIPGPVIIDDDLTKKSLGRNLEYIEDRDKSIAFEDIVSDIKTKNLKWTKSEEENPGFGFTSSVIWVRFSLVNPTNNNIEFYLQQEYPPLDYIHVYIPDGKGGFEIMKSGDCYPFSQRDVAYRNFIFPLKIRAKSGLTYYVRYETSGSMNILLSVLTYDTFHQIKDDEAIFFWMFYGIFLVMFVYNLIIFIATRDWSYFYYVLYIASFGLFIMSMKGMSFQYLWPNNIWLSNFSVPITMSVIIFSIIQFVVFFIGLKNLSIFWYRIVHVPSMIAVLLFFVTVISRNYHLAVITTNFLAGLAALLGIVGGTIWATYYKSTQARFFLGSFMAFLLGVIMMVLNLRGIIPTNVFTENGILVGAVLQVITLSLGLADKINAMRRELKVLNIDLERKVEERTTELQATLEELEAMNQTLTDTRDALWGEMELARKIQTVLLPTRPRIPGYEIAAYMDPADEVGGDYYDIINTGGYNWIVIGDVSGHGVPAGLVMMMVQTSINLVLNREPGISPSQLLTTVNSTIRENILRMGEDKYMTMTVLASMKEGTFTFAGLHQDILVYRAGTGKVESIDTQGMWIGIVEDLEGMNPDDSLSLDRGDVCLLYTDGITEAWIKGNIRGQRTIEEDMFGDQRLFELFGRLASGSPEQIKDGIVKELEGYECQDDVTMVVLKKN